MMANKGIFGGGVSKPAPPTDTVNEAGGTAYKMSPKHALAQLAHTGTFSDQFYTSGQDQLATISTMLSHADVTPEFVAKLAVYARTRGFMKDMPAFLCAWLTTQGAEGREVLSKAFPLVIDNGRMIRNFVQMMRSGVLGRKSLGSFPKRLVQNWLTVRPPWTVFRATVGQDPSIADVIKMVHPKPTTEEKAASFAYMIGKEHDREKLPKLIQDYEAWKADPTKDVPAVPFQMLTHAKLSAKQWKQICENGGWHFVRMNINTFTRHKVFEISGMEQFVADKLRDPEAIANAKVFPYQLLAAYKFAEGAPRKVINALHDALEIAVKNVPSIGDCIICVDTSGSMTWSPVTGQRGDSSSKVMAIDVAGLIASVILRQNPDSKVIQFAGHAGLVALEPRDTVMTNASKLAAFGGGGTNCGAALALANQRGFKAQNVIYVSDNESWVETAGLGGRGGVGRYGGYYSGTETMQQWEVFRGKNPNAKLINIDTAAYTSTQTSERGDVMNIGGFSDQVFEVMKEFVSGKYGAGAWLAAIEAVKI